MHTTGTGPDLLLVEGTAGGNTDIEVDGDPHVKLQEPQFSHLTTPEEAEFLTLPSSPSPWHHPPSRGLLVRSTHQPPTLQRRPSQNQNMAQIWSCRTARCCPLLLKLLGHSICRLSTQGRRLSRIQRTAQIWRCHPRHGHQMRPRNLPLTSCPS